MTKPKNDDEFEYYVIEDKPKRKPKEDAYGDETARGRWALMVGALVVILGIGAVLLVNTSPTVFTNSVTFTTVSTTVSTTVATTVSTSVTTIIDGAVQAPQPTPVPTSAIDLAWSPDGKTLAVMTLDSLRLYRTDDLSQSPATVQSGGRSISSAAYNAVGTRLAVAWYQPSADPTPPFDMTTISLFNPERLLQLAVIEGQSGLIHHLAFSPDGTRLAAYGDDRQVHVWDVNTRAVTSAPSDLNYIDDLAFTRQGDLLVAGSNDILLESTYQHILEKWSLSTGEDNPFVLSTYDSVIYTMHLSDDGSRLVVVSDAGIEVWDTADHFMVESLADNLAAETYQLAVSRDGRRVAVGRQQTVGGSVLQLWNVADNQMVRLAAGDLGVIRVLSLSPDGSRVALGLGDGRLQLRDSTTGSLLVETRL